jgi:hypothetical protein
MKSRKPEGDKQSSGMERMMPETLSATGCSFAEFALMATSEIAR